MCGMIGRQHSWELRAPKDRRAALSDLLNWASWNLLIIAKVLAKTWVIKDYFSSQLRIPNPRDCTPKTLCLEAGCVADLGNINLARAPDSRPSLKLQPRGQPRVS